MNTKTMEGLVGAGTSANLMNTPVRVFQDAERRGDTATMERAMGYAAETADQAEKYQMKAHKGMEEDAKEAKEKAELDRAQAIQKSREEKQKLEERIDENRSGDTNADMVEISEEGKAYLKEHADLSNAGSEGTAADMVNEPVTYTKTGEVIPMEGTI